VRRGVQSETEARLHRVFRLVGWAFVVESSLLSMFSLANVASRTWATVPAVVLASIVTGLIPFSASLIATFNQKLAARIYLSAAPIALLLIPLFPSEFWGMLGTMVAFGGAAIVPGFFWRLAARRNWPSPIPRSFPSQHPGLTPGLAMGIFGLWLVGAFVSSLALPWWAPIGDCGTLPLLDEHGAPRNIDFTAKVLFVGPKSFLGKSLWAIARVEEGFSTPPLPKIVILRAFLEPSDKSVSYFVEGRRSYGPFFRFLPMIERTDCGRTQYAKDATVPLRILRDGPPKSGVRLIGRARIGRSYGRVLGRAVPGLEVSIVGPSGPIVSLTDSEGVYDVKDLPPGQYTVHAQIRNVQGGASEGRGDAELKSGEVGEANLYLQ